MLRNLGMGAVPIHGQMNQPKRLAALNMFKVPVLLFFPTYTHKAEAGGTHSRNRGIRVALMMYSSMAWF